MNKERDSRDRSRLWFNGERKKKRERGGHTKNRQKKEKEIERDTIEERWPNENGMKMFETTISKEGV